MSSGSGSANPNGDSVVPHPPGDTVSQLRWSPSGTGATLVSASSWSKEVRVWDVALTGQATPKLSVPHPAPVLAHDWTQDGQVLLSGACDGIVRMTALSNSGPATVELGQHAAPVKALFWNKTVTAAITGSWDKTVRCFDPRKAPKPTSSTSSTATSMNGQDLKGMTGTGSGSDGACVLSIKVPERVHAMDNREMLVAVATGDRGVTIYDLRNTRTPFREYVPFLNKQSSCLCLFPDNRAFALGSIEGRVHIQHLDVSPDPIEAKRQSFTYRCHKVGDYDAFAVNALAVAERPVSPDSFATAGSDGTCVFWDKAQKKRLHQFKPMPQPVTACAFNKDGSIFAYAIGYDWSKGFEGFSRHREQYPSPQILLHSVDPAEMTPPTQSI